MTRNKILNRCLSYSFSFQLKTIQDIIYFKRTNKPNTFNHVIENFILKFIKDNKKIVEKINARKYNKLDNESKRYTSCTVSLKESTITKIREYKRLKDVPNLDENTEEYIKLIVPSREL